MTEIRTTANYDRWFSGLRDRKARGRIDVRLRRLADGDPGDFRAVGSGVLELRISYGPGYRIYYAERGEMLIILLAGGSKRTQERDIRMARELAQAL